jgi:hypothetical protein
MTHEIPMGDVRSFNSLADAACVAPEEVFIEDYNLIPVAIQAAIESTDGLPCEGGGVPGYWCAMGCPWYLTELGLQEQYGLSFEDLGSELDVIEG